MYIYTCLFVSIMTRDSDKNTNFNTTGTSKLLCGVVPLPPASISSSFSISKHVWAERQLDSEKSASSGWSCCQTGEEPGDESFSIRPSAALLEQYRRQYRIRWRRWWRLLLSEPRERPSDVALLRGDGVCTPGSSHVDSTAPDNGGSTRQVHPRSDAFLLSQVEKN